ncbi:hypothetical protein J2X16_001164 [Pelomonas aquatica]|uniref:Uncharacterized protein n=1 Tax=Pelomonas aquatica TaxID=431058 RepID=A0ABU1Z5F1_9BURK|nr:hypothetical protein [Pelomonas aquatica]MDR7295843.1 hypothetical protein [Pelomonas aquatica]
MARGAPHAEAVAHEQLDARAARVGEQIAMVSLAGTEDLHDTSEQPLGPGAHVDGLDRHPHRVDAD